jgi:CheY-like chemotaxis protein
MSSANRPRPQTSPGDGSSGIGRRVLIVDDNADFRRLARGLLEHLRPAIVLLDIQLPDMDGFQVADLLAAEPAAPDIVLISSRDSGSYRRQLELTSARGFIAKAELSADSLAQALS